MACFLCATCGDVGWGSSGADPKAKEHFKDRKHAIAFSLVDATCWLAQRQVSDGRYCDKDVRQTGALSATVN